jgi:hypothetical protein
MADPQRSDVMIRMNSSFRRSERGHARGRIIARYGTAGAPGRHFSSLFSLLTQP